MVRIMIVDDAAADRVLVARILKRNAEWSVTEAVDGKDALQQLEKETCDLLLTDLQMPEMDGLDLVSAVRERYPTIPCVLMTSAGSEEAAVQALKAGASSYVPKRRMMQDLTETIGSVLIAAGCERANQRILARVVESHTRIVIETNRSLVDALLEYLRGIIQSIHGLDSADHVRLCIALDEALANALYHGNLELSSSLRDGADGNRFYELADERSGQSPWQDRRIEVAITLSEGQLQVVVRDEGPGFDVSKLPDPTDPEYIARPHGRGVMLMRTFLDEVRYNDVGNELTLIKRLTPDSSN